MYKTSSPGLSLSLPNACMLSCLSEIGTVCIAVIKPGISIAVPVLPLVDITISPVNISS